MAATQTQTLSGGSFYGAVQGRQESCGVITDLLHGGARKMPAHAHELPFCALILEGDYAERYGRQQNYFGPFTVSFRPAGVPHQDEVGPRGVRFFEMEIRPEWQRRLQDASGKLDTAYDDHGGGKVLWLAMKLFRETRGPVPEHDVSVESLIAELLATVAGIARQPKKDAPGWLRRVVAKINDEYCSRLTLDELSVEAGVHPVHLSRVFRKCKGEGIGEYVHRLRIRAACEQLSLPEISLAQISSDTGFSDQSHFTRVFGRMTGMSPAKFRKMLPRGRASAKGSDPPVNYRTKSLR